MAGWMPGENPGKKVYDVAWSDGRKPGANGKLPAVGDTVDLAIPELTNTIGAAELGPCGPTPSSTRRCARFTTPV